ncbi:RidA family protein [Spirillospora sp. NBC_00431]
MTQQITTISTPDAPAPAGPYSQIVRAGDFVFLAGQTARTPEGRVADGADRAAQCRQALTNLGALATAAGGSLADTVKVTVYLADLTWKQDFDAVYAELVGPTPARTTVCAAPPTGHVEVDAILYLPEHA